MEYGYTRLLGELADDQRDDVIVSVASAFTASFEPTEAGGIDVLTHGLEAVAGQIGLMSGKCQHTCAILALEAAVGLVEALHSNMTERLLMARHEKIEAHGQKPGREASRSSRDEAIENLANIANMMRERIASRKAGETLDLVDKTLAERKAGISKRRRELLAMDKIELTKLAGSIGRIEEYNQEWLMDFILDHEFGVKGAVKQPKAEKPDTSKLAESGYTRDEIEYRKAVSRHIVSVCELIRPGEAVSVSLIMDTASTWFPRGETLPDNKVISDLLFGKRDDKRLFLDGFDWSHYVTTPEWNVRRKGRVAITPDSRVQVAFGVMHPTSLHGINAAYEAHVELAAEKAERVKAEMRDAGILPAQKYSRDLIDLRTKILRTLMMYLETMPEGAQVYITEIAGAFSPLYEKSALKRVLIDLLEGSRNGHLLIGGITVPGSRQYKKVGTVTLNWTHFEAFGIDGDQYAKLYRSNRDEFPKYDRPVKRLDITRHIQEAMASYPVSKFVSVAEIAHTNTPAAWEAGHQPSTSAVMARLFGTLEDPRNDIEGVEPGREVPGELSLSSRKGARRKIGTESGPQQLESIVPAPMPADKPAGKFDLSAGVDKVTMSDDEEDLDDDEDEEDEGEVED